MLETSARLLGPRGRYQRAVHTNKPLTRRYRTAIGANVPRAKVISRADVAYAMFAMLDDPSAITQAVGVSG